LTVLDLKLVREQPDFVISRLTKRGKSELADEVRALLRLDQQRRTLIAELDAMRARRNEVSPEVGRLKQAGRHADAEPLVREMRELGERMVAVEKDAAAAESRVRDCLLNIPNLPTDAVPDGGPECNTVIRTWGEPHRFSFDPRTHWSLGESLGILDLPRGTKLAGSGFPLLVGAGARLERALIQLMLDVHTREHGYTEVAPPLLVNSAAAVGTGHLPKFGDDMYRVAEDDLFLIPTAEIPVTNLYADEILDADELPRRFVAYTPCFRREAGAHGKDTRGILRVHQFDKVELVRFERPAQGAAALEELVRHAESILQRLGLHYRVVLLAGGDLGFANAQTYDLEVWAPGVERWLEVSSCSLYNDYQARRAGIRFRPAPNAKPEYVATLNGSGLGLPRTLIAVLETYQQEDGSIALPEALAAYAGMDRIAV
jgi:seryl-tRNA synthetase